MKIFAIAATALVAAVAYAAPAPLEDRSSNYVSITFIAAPVEFTKVFPTDGSVFKISTQYLLSLPEHHILTVERTDNDLSVNLIKSEGGATCTFYGIDGSVTTVTKAETVAVGPPQTQVSGTCRAL